MTLSPRIAARLPWTLGWPTRTTTWACFWKKLATPRERSAISARTGDSSETKRPDLEADDLPFRARCRAVGRLRCWLRPRSPHRLSLALKPSACQNELDSVGDAVTAGLTAPGSALREEFEATGAAGGHGISRRSIPVVRRSYRRRPGLILFPQEACQRHQDDFPHTFLREFAQE